MGVASLARALHAGDGGNAAMDLETALAEGAVYKASGHACTEISNIVCVNMFKHCVCFQTFISKSI